MTESNAATTPASELMSSARLHLSLAKAMAKVQRERIRPGLGDPGLEAESAHRRLGEAPLDRIVVHDQYGSGHGGSRDGTQGSDARPGWHPGRGLRFGGCFVSNRMVTERRKVPLNDVSPAPSWHRHGIAGNMANRPR